MKTTDLNLDEAQRAALIVTRATARVVSAYVGHAHVPRHDVAALIRSVSGALAASRAVLKPDPAAPLPEPAVARTRSVSDGWIICLEDGERFKSLRRHLSAKYGLTPDEYRARWGLPANYPMVAPAYARERSKLARELGLGRKRQTKAAV